jgi:hypothetical protein
LFIGAYKMRCFHVDMFVFIIDINFGTKLDANNLLMTYNIKEISVIVPITMAARSVAGTVYARSNAGIMGSHPNQGMDVCVRSFCVHVVLCVGRGLATGDHLSKESYRLCKKDYEIEDKARAQQRSVEPLMNE